MGLTGRFAAAGLTIALAAVAGGSRSLARRGGIAITPRDYLSRGWRYAVAGTVPALLVLVAVH